MNKIWPLFNILTSLVAINFIHVQSKEVALLFKAETNAIINPANSKNTDICNNCAVACPFQSKSISENYFNNQHSITKKTLFVKEVYPNQLTKNINLGICETEFELSVTYNTVTKEVEFGYELYYEDSSDNKELKESIYSKYGPITDLPTEYRTLSRASFSFKKSFSFPSDGPKFPLENKQMRFLWISAFNLNYNGVIRSPNRVTYKTSVSIPDSSETCQNYKLGGEMYNDINMVQIYQKENLEEIFKGKVIPKINETDPRYTMAEEMVVDKDLPVCIIKWNLIPEKYFHFYSPTTLSCSYLTTVPVWCYIADGLLKRLDEYIEIITQIIPEKKLQIHSGTNGILKTIIKAGEPVKKTAILRTPKTFVDTFLFNNENSNKIPIPASIYKIIKYESSKCPKKEDKCLYSVLIEIHNAPYFRSKDRICTTDRDECMEWGWNSFFENKNIQPPYVSCCHMTSEMKEKLKLPKTNEDKKLPKIPKYIFNLKEYKVEYTENFDVLYKPLKEQADEKMEGLRTGTSTASNEKIEELEEETETQFGSNQPNVGEATDPST